MGSRERSKKARAGERGARATREENKMLELRTTNGVVVSETHVYRYFAHSQAISRESGDTPWMC